MANFIISKQEAIDLIRNHYNLDSTVNIAIESDEPEGWIDCPKGWDSSSPPPAAKKYDQVQVQFRNGSISEEYREPDRWCYFWRQDNNHGDVIKFRPKQ